ncbi:PLD nuclease N-terminal domain-containing protein [Spongisporangium articulatum]|uniref:PLD nuclease N-terminal domain-containing protein n=1 Tax=Spongisporangium articulatum TaxID=3362603 RepID=A0ABW8ANN1_9ACTN
MGQVVLALVIIGVTIYAFIDCARCDPTTVRGLPKPFWLVVIVVLAPVGGIAWILMGDSSAPNHQMGRSPRTIAPDDDPDFLRSLNNEPNDVKPDDEN